MIAGFFRLKDRRSRRPGFAVDPWPVHLWKRAQEVLRFARSWVGLLKEMEEIWLATRPRSEREKQVVREIERLRGIQKLVAESAYDLIIYNVENIWQRDTYMREIPRRERTDGVIIISLSPRNEDIPYLVHADVPIVLVDANHPSLDQLNRVIIDDVRGGCQATQHLIDLGHRRIGLISDYLEEPLNFTSSRDRYHGYCQSLQAFGIPYIPEYHIQGEHGRTQACRMAIELLSLPQPPTAIFATSDTQAMGVLQAARELGLRVPDDLSVIGYDDIEVAEYLGLSTVRQLLLKTGQRGVELLLEILQQPQMHPVCEVMPTELVVRGTTAPPKMPNNFEIGR